MKKQKGMVFFRNKFAVNKNDVCYIGKDGSFMSIYDVYENIDKKSVREHIMKTAKHITSNYSNNKIAVDLLNKHITERVVWYSDHYFTEKKELKYEFIHV